MKDVDKFSKFVSQLNYKHKIVIAGNHDFCFESELKEEAESIFKRDQIIYLNDSEVIIENKKFYGSPIQPWFHDWAFNRQRGEEINKHWLQIPIDTDILITHGPPYGILDKCYHGARVGCEDLLKKVKEIRPKIHAFGHIHEEYGTTIMDNIVFVNACSLDEKYKVVNNPIEIILD